MKIAAPRVSFTRLKKIIVGFHTINKDLVNTTELSNFMMGSIDPSDISGSAKFLVSINLLVKYPQRGYYKVTQTCKHLGHAIKDSDGKKEVQILRDIIKGSDTLQKIHQRIQYISSVSGSVKLNDLKIEIIRLCEWEDNSKKNKHVYNQYTKTIIDIFKDARYLNSISNDRFAVMSFESPDEFINSKFINELTKLDIKSKFDLSRLIYYCQQININYLEKQYEAVAFLSRAIIHHVPPIFDQPNFESVGAQAKGKSFKKSCINLQNSLKHIVDDLIHSPISNSVTPLSPQEIMFMQDLNRLIRGVIDELKQEEHNN